MTASPVSGPARTRAGTDSMRAAVFERPGVITLQERPVPKLSRIGSDRCSVPEAIGPSG